MQYGMWLVCGFRRNQHLFQVEWIDPASTEPILFSKTARTYSKKLHVPWEQPPAVAAATKTREACLCQNLQAFGRSIQCVGQVVRVSLQFVQL